jgi:hypothetical protein
MDEQELMNNKKQAMVYELEKHNRLAAEEVRTRDKLVRFGSSPETQSLEEFVVLGFGVVFVQRARSSLF